MKKHQVVIVGGGPAGAACAGKLVQAGLDCLVVDKAVFPRDKVCAGWLTPGVFRTLGMHPEEYPADLSVFSSLRIYLNGFPVRWPGKQFAIRRLEFDHWLLEISGAQVLHHEVKDIQVTEHGFCLDNEIEAEILVGAGGTHCPVYRKYYADAYPRRGARIIALEDEFQEQWEDPSCRLWFFENKLPGYSWYVPKKGGYVNIGVGGNKEIMKQRGSTIQEQWRYLEEKTRQMGLFKKKDLDPHGYVYHLSGNAPPNLADNLYLSGDAVGLATLDMGEGIGPAIESGLMTARAILDQAPVHFDSLPQYSLLPTWLRWIFRKQGKSI